MSFMEMCLRCLRCSCYFVNMLTVSRMRAVGAGAVSSPHPLQICHKLPAPSLNTNFPPGSVTLKLIFAAIENSITLKLAHSSQCIGFEKTLCLAPRHHHIDTFTILPTKSFPLRLIFALLTRFPPGWLSG